MIFLVFRNTLYFIRERPRYFPLIQSFATSRLRPKKVFNLWCCVRQIFATLVIRDRCFENYSLSCALLNLSQVIFVCYLSSRKILMFVFIHWVSDLRQISHLFYIGVLLNEYVKIWKLKKQTQVSIFRKHIEIMFLLHIPSQEKSAPAARSLYKTCSSFFSQMKSLLNSYCTFKT